ncbi:solute carrier family 25 member 46 isoform X1 [Drosophila sechellia]|uniref:GM17264 n=1 Tax=Drosophila sechellia TaxID=7238 RepID=B4I5E6_DROSE|nr:solute carrier family 25 member 46 isoform X1 [Drosophila sechellia]EDW55602.1 GM17264 [Drosophila sechellia]
MECQDLKLDTDKELIDKDLENEEQTCNLVPSWSPRNPLENSIDCREKSIVENINADQDAIAKIQYLSSEHGKLDKYLDNQEQDESLRKYLVVGVHWVSLLTEHVLSHPFLVLRWQCQVYNASKCYHLHPFTLLPCIVHLHRRQGLTTLWKGMGSCLLVRGMSCAIDDVISKLSSWPKELDSRTTLKRFGQHVLLKCVSIALVLPFHTVSLVKTVQSGIASDKTGLLDVLREGGARIFLWRSPQNTRMLPMWALIGPSISIGITKYLFNLLIHGVSTRMMQRRMLENRYENNSDNNLEHQNAETYAGLIAMLTTEVVFFPLETILHRLELQGTRTIIDNLDTGFSVVPVLTDYRGLFDCYRVTVISEGAAGLYKGFGAMILQFVAQVAIIKLAKWTADQIAAGILNRPTSRIVQTYNFDSLSCNKSSMTKSPSISSIDVELTSLGKYSLDE